MKNISEIKRAKCQTRELNTDAVVSPGICEVTMRRFVYTQLFFYSKTFTDSGQRVGGKNKIVITVSLSKYVFMSASLEKILYMGD